jgi:2,4-dienoyl-CoA reductase-like NADH-dependent reductase (Old Yellow Enzyme family)
MANISEPFTFPCGITIKNRIVKAALAEWLCHPRKGNPTPLLEKLYTHWAEGGTGMLISGHVMVDRVMKASTRDPVLDEKSNLESFKSYAKAATLNNTKCILQINHPGRQCPSACSTKPVAPSAVPLTKYNFFFKNPRALTEQEIEEIIEKFTYTAVKSKECGFHGVELHAAHGYLLSQFLNPVVNRREDKWGGSLENRSRIIFQIIKNIRKEVGREGFIVGLKINSADFQKGGFTNEECTKLVKLIDEEKDLDFVELSGGSVEAPPDLMNEKVRESTKRREAFFQEFGEDLKKELKNVPLLLTGGFRTVRGMNNALKEGLDLIGLGRPLIVEPDIVNKLIDGSRTETLQYKIPGSEDLGIFWHAEQIGIVARKGSPNLKKPLSKSFLLLMKYDYKASYTWIYILAIFILILALLFYYLYPILMDFMF